jgi:ABC-2 type transport system permease protein
MIVGELYASRELLRNLVLRDLRGRYKRSVLGIVWSLINPLASLLVYATVFRYLLKAQPAPGDPSELNNFALWLMCGLLPWAFFSTATSTALRSVADNAGLVRKVYFPREVLVIGTIGALGVTFGIEMLLLIIALLIGGNMVLPWIPMLLVLMVLLFAFSVGVSLVLAASYVYFRDLSHLWTVAMQVGFYAVPVIYPITLLQDYAVPYNVVRYNPLSVFVSSIRNVLFDLRMPPTTHLLYLLAWTVAMVIIGFGVFRRLAPRFAEEV